MSMDWPKYPRSGTEASFVTPPGQYKSCAGTYASFTGGLGLQPECPTLLICMFHHLVFLFANKVVPLHLF